MEDDEEEEEEVEVFSDALRTKVDVVVDGSGENTLRSPLSIPSHFAEW